MKKISLLLSVLLFFTVAPAACGGDEAGPGFHRAGFENTKKFSKKIDPVLTAAVGPKKSLKEDLFSVSTEEMDSSDSLNRIAGKYDTGFSSAEQSYKAKDRAGAGPFAHEKAETTTKDSY